MRLPRGDAVIEKGVEEGHDGGRGTKGEEQMLMKIFWPSSSRVLTVNLKGVGELEIFLVR